MTQDIWKKKLLATTLFAGVAGAVWAAPMHAQAVSAPATEDEAADDEDEDVAVIEEAEDEARQDRVVVTGSRLIRDEFTSSSPIQVVDGEISKSLGLVNAADLVQQSTVSQGQQIDLGLSTSAGLSVTDNPSGPGAANLDLRGLGAGRTLVLVNGRRLAPSGVRGAPSAPDINLVPGSLIERVEILLDGASSVYGSDAVAGVANYILRREFDGLEFDFYASQPNYNDGAGAQKQFTVTYGLNDEDGFLTTAVEYTEINAVTWKDFGGFYDRYAECGAVAQVISRDSDGNLYDQQCGNGTIGAGVLQTPFGFAVYAPGESIGPYLNDFGVRGITGATLRPESVDLLIHPENEQDFFSPDLRRITALATGEYNTGLYGDLTTYFEASYAYREVYDVNKTQGSIYLPGEYALNPFTNGGIDPDQADTNVFFRQLINTDTSVDQGRLIGGVKGDLPFMNFGPVSDWSYDAYASYSRSEGNDVIQGLVANDRIIRTLENTVISPVTGQPGCTPEILAFGAEEYDQFDPVNCQAADFLDPGFLFTGRFNDPVLDRYFFPNRFTRTVVEQTLLQGTTQGKFGELPGGDVLALLGVEYRSDEIQTQTDRAASGNELIGDFVDLGANGERSLFDVFGEVSLPFLSGQPFAEELRLELSARYTEEENFGDDTTYRVTGVYAPTDWLTFRGTYGTSFRAPDVGEQFGSQVADFSATRGAGDPCLTPGVAFAFVDSDNDPTTPDDRVYDPNLDPRTPELLAQCRNGGGPEGFVGVDPTAFGVTGAGTNNLVFLGVSPLVTEGSNEDLQPETSDAYTVGFVVDRPNVGPFDVRFATTYFNIKVQNQVTELSEVEVVTSCYDGDGELDDPLCGFMTRDPLSGNVATVNAQLQNIGEIRTSGLDFNLDLYSDVTLPGNAGEVGLNLIFNATRTLELEEDFINSSEDLLGEHGNPRWRANLTGLANYGDFSVLWRTRYLDHTQEANEDPQDPDTSPFSPCVQAGAPNCTQYDTAEPYFVHDLSAAYNADTWALRVGINNVFEDQPPFANIPFRGIYYTQPRTVFANITKSF